MSASGNKNIKLQASRRTPTDSNKHPPLVKKKNCDQNQRARKKSRERGCAGNLLCCFSDFLLVHTCIMKPIKV